MNQLLRVSRILMIVLMFLFFGIGMVWPDVLNVLRTNLVLGYSLIIIVGVLAFLAILDVYKSHFEIEKFTGKMIFQATLYIVALLIIILMVRNV